MARFAQRHPVFFVEEPLIDATYTEVTRVGRNLFRVVPHLAEGKSAGELLALWRGQLALLRAEHRIDRPILWYDTPSAVPVTRGFARCLTVYDCTLDLAAYAGIAPELIGWEAELVRDADLMLVRSRGLLATKRLAHPNSHLAPDCMDLARFARVRAIQPIPDDQAELPRPIVGYTGVVDDRIDFTLLEELADRRPDWSFVLLGPVAERFRHALPRRDNLHYLRDKPRVLSPGYVAGFQVAMLPCSMHPLAHASASRTTLEYLAAGKPVVSTALPDVIEPFARLSLVRVAEHAAGFGEAIAEELRGEHVAGPAQREEILVQSSWDFGFRRMYDHLQQALLQRGEIHAAYGGKAGVQPAQH
jgi:UDP-galactopyranose mutase